MEPFGPALQLGILAAALVLAAYATLMQRRPEPTPDWPPSPPPPPHVRRDLLVVSSAMMFLVFGLGVGAVAVVAALLQLVTGVIGGAPIP